jgi:hypothetical protein
MVRVNAGRAAGAVIMGTATTYNALNASMPDLPMLRAGSAILASITAACTAY